MRENTEKLQVIMDRELNSGRSSLIFSCYSLELVVSIGEKEEGILTISSQDGKPVRGNITLSEPRMKCASDSFAGVVNEIPWQFDSSGMEIGQRLTGAFHVISNQGEYTIPYSVVIRQKAYASSLGEIRNLFHFTNLARTNWQEAVKLFYRPDFEEILAGNDRQYLNVYHGLSNVPGKEQCLEEFLLQIHKKQKMEYIADKESLLINSTEGITEEVIRIMRNGWGYTYLQIELEGEFLYTEKNALTDDDFLGNSCDVAIQILHHKLHDGKNCGKIRLFNEYVSLEIPVFVSREYTLLGKAKRNHKKNVLEFMKLYVRYGLGQIREDAFISEMEQKIDQIGLRNGNPIRELLQTQVLLLKERYNEAKWLLEQAGNLIMQADPPIEVWCYYLYLTTLCGGNDQNISDAIGRVREAYERNQTNWIIAWLLLYMDENYADSPYRRWMFLEQQFEKGCHSPVWYMEAAILLQKNPALLMKLTPFTLQTLHFMSRYDCLNEEIIRQIHYLAERMKNYSQIMYEILCSCYEKAKDTETLQAICIHLIKGNKTAPEYAKWYREGIDNTLWIANLYEFYMLSIDLNQEEEIPEAALRYFAYHSTLPHDRNAYLYAYIIRNREKYPLIYMSYLPDMESFLTKQLELGKINKDLAYLYQNMIREGLITKSYIDKYADMLFFHEIRVKDLGMRRIIVVHGKLKHEKSYPVRNGIAYVPVYSKDVSFVFEGENGGRFISCVDYRDRELFHPQDTLAEVGSILEASTGVILYECEQDRIYTLVNKDNADYARKLIGEEELNEEFRKELGLKLLRFYSEKDYPEEVDRLFFDLRPDFMTSLERSEVISSLIARGIYDIAFEWICKYGMERLQPKLLVRLCNHLIDSPDSLEKPELLRLAYYSFESGKYNENMLRYLQNYYKGTSRELLAIWDACRKFDVDCHELSERLIVQILFTGDYCRRETEVFRKYLAGSGNADIISAFLKHIAAKYFIAGVEVEQFIFEELQRNIQNDESLGDICSLALLEYYSKKEQLNEEEEANAAKLLHQLLQKNLLFDFFQKFDYLYPTLQFLFDRSFLEYRTESENPIYLHYMIKGTASADKGEYRTEELKSVVPGVFSKNFTLFFGEKLDYYITEKVGERERLLTDGTISRTETERMNAESRYGRINGLALSVSVKNYDACEMNLEEFWQRETLAKELFTLL